MPVWETRRRPNLYLILAAARDTRVPLFSFADSPEFLRLLRGESEADLTQIAMEVARDGYPMMDSALYLAKIDALADRVRDRCREGARPRHISAR